MKINRQINIPLTFMFLILFFNSGCQTGNKPIHATFERNSPHPIESTGSTFAISTQGIYASKAAQHIYEQGGNIIDAVVAASFVISVERPQSTGLGGGGFMIYQTASGESYAIDFRERAPLKATADMYIEKGKLQPDQSRTGYLAVATPGMTQGLFEIHKKFGKLDWSKIVQPAVDLAENGFPIYGRLHEALVIKKDILKKSSAARKIFLDSNNEAFPVGHNLVQKDLAETLKRIAVNGSDEVIGGTTAKKILEASRRGNGILTARDFKKYKVKWTKPIEGTFKDYQILSMPPPSSGGVHVIQFLNFLENDKLNSQKNLSTHSIHLAASALQSAFADRAHYLGDPEFVPVPTQKLIAKEYSAKRRAEVSLNRARPSDGVSFGKLEPTETTHISAMDSLGNAISTTQTINGYFGAGVVAAGTGIVLNNEMDDFTAQVGASNIFGAIGGKQNSIEPLKTPLSSMSPTLVLKDKKPIMSVGAPGGTTIISCVAQTILNYLEFNLNLKDSVSSVRYHHQWKPDLLRIDPPGPGPQVMAELKKMGYKVELSPIGCYVMAVAREEATLRAVSDPRDIGTGVAF